jgi:hypothetical protein
MMPKPQVEIALRTPLPTHRWDCGERIFGVLSEVDSRLVPERVGYTEEELVPVTSNKTLRTFWILEEEEDSETPGVPHSSHSLEWRRRSKLRQSGYVRHASRNRRGELVPGSIKFSSDWNRSIDFSQVFRSWADLTEPTLGMVHLFPEQEQLYDTESTLGEWDYFRQGWVDFQMGSFGAALDPTIPNIGWGMIFGGDYAAEVNVDEIRAQGFPVDPMGTGWFVRVTDKLADVIDDYPHFARRRAELRRCFREDLFLITTEPGLAPSVA